MGVLKETYNHLIRAVKRARITAKASTINRTARFSQIADLETMRHMLEDICLFLEGAELAAELRYDDSKAQEVRDIQQAEDLDAMKLLSDARFLFEVNDVGTVLAFLRRLGKKPKVFAAAFGRLEPEIQRALFSSLRESVNDLQKLDGVIEEDSKPV